MKKITKNSYLNMEKYSNMIYNVDELLDSKFNVNKEYSTEWIKYLLASIDNEKIDVEDSYYLDYNDICTISNTNSRNVDYDKINNIISTLVESKFIIVDNDNKFYFNENVFDKNLVKKEKEKFNILNKNEFCIEYMNFDWELIETEKQLKIKSYSRTIQKNITFASILKKEIEISNNYIDIGILLDTPKRFKLLQEIYLDIKNIGDLKLYKKIKNLLYNICKGKDEIINLESIEHYKDFLENQKDEKFKIIHVSEVYNIFLLFEIVNSLGTILNVYLEDINITEIMNTMRIIVNYQEIENILFDVIETLGSDNFISEKIISSLYDSISNSFFY